MTQAFNLSQFANKVNTSGQADLTTAVSGTLPVNNGGTGVTSVGASGNVLTSNGSAWVSSAPAGGGVTSLNGQTGAITNTSSFAIGSYIAGRPANVTNYAIDVTIAGSSLYSTATRGGYYSTSGAFIDTNATLINVGTWRCTSNAYALSPWGYAGIWVRIS